MHLLIFLKRFLIVFGVFFLGLTVALVVTDWGVVQEAQSGSRKQVEIFDQTIFGYDSGLKRWQVEADYVWAGRSQNIFRAEAVHSGKLFDGTGDVVLQGLSGGQLKVNARSKTLTVSDGVSCELLGRDDQGRLLDGETVSSDIISITCGELKFFNVSNRAYLRYGVEVRQGNRLIEVPGLLEYDTSTHIASVADGVHFSSESFAVTADRMSLNVDTDSATFEGRVFGYREVEGAESDIDAREASLKAQKTYFEADRLSYETGSANALIVTLMGHVRLWQDDGKVLSGDVAIYDRAADRFQLNGKSRLESPTLAWLLDERQKRFQNEYIVETIESPVTVNCNEILFYPDSRALHLTGGVQVKQASQTVKANAVSYLDQTGRLLLNGDVVVDRSAKDTLKSARIEVDVYKEDIISDTPIDAVFHLD